MPVCTVCQPRARVVVIGYCMGIWVSFKRVFVKCTLGGIRLFHCLDFQASMFVDLRSWVEKVAFTVCKAC